MATKALNRWWGILMLVVFTACSSTKLTVNVLRTGPIEISQTTQKVAVINRVSPSASTKQFVNGHIVTQFNGLTPIMVNEATQQIIQGFDQRYFIATFDTTSAYLPPSENFNRGFVATEQLNAACQSLGVDGILTISGYDANIDSDSEVRYSTPVDRTYGTVRIPYFEGQQSVEMRMLFRYYSCTTQGGINEDETELSIQKSLSTTASSFYEVKNTQRESASILVAAAQGLGVDYVNEFGPQEMEETRKLYVKGSAQMTEAYQRAITGNWKAAADIWYNLATSSNRKVAGWATYNLIVANELMGNFEEARSLAQLCQEKYQMQDAAQAELRVAERQKEMHYIAKVFPKLIIQ